MAANPRGSHLEHGSKQSRSTRGSNGDSPRTPASSIGLAYGTEAFGVRAEDEVLGVANLVHCLAHLGADGGVMGIDVEQGAFMAGLRPQAGGRIGL